MFKSHYLRLTNMLEGRMARHWPEVTSLVDLTAPTLLALLARFGGSSEVAADAQGARRLMHSVSNGHDDLGAVRVGEHAFEVQVSDGDHPVGVLLQVGLLSPGACPDGRLVVTKAGRGIAD